MKSYICLVTVKVKAPANYKPRTASYTLACYTEERTSRFRSEVENNALSHIKKCLTEQNPGIDFKYTVSSEVKEIFGIYKFEGKNKEAAK